MRTTFLRKLAIHASLAFFISLVVSCCFETSLCRREIRNRIVSKFNEQHEYSQNARQTYRSLDSILKNNALVNARAVASLIQLDPSWLDYSESKDKSRLIELAKIVCVDRIDIASADGLIEHGLPASIVGFDYKTSNHAKEFLKILDNPELEIVQPIRHSEGIDGDFYQYAATVRLDAPGFVEIGMNAEELQPIYELANMSNYVSSRIGRDGFMAVFLRDVENDSLILSSVGKDASTGALRLPNQMLEKMLDDQTTLPLKDFDLPCNKLFSCSVGNRRHLVFAQWKDNGKILFIGGVPHSDVFAEKSLQILLTLAGNFFVFFMIFIFTARLVQTLFVNSVSLINHSLGVITSGNLRERVKVYVSKEFADLSRGINATVDSLKDAAAEVERKTKEEMALARRIQESTLPDLETRFDHSPFVDVYACTRPNASVGGDAFDFFFVNESTIFFYVVDVAGSGVSAALVAMKTMALVNNLALSNLSLEEIVQTTNRCLAESSEATIASAIFCLLDLKSGRVQYVDAGHPYPVVKRKGQSFELLKVDRSIMLGCDQDASFQASSFVLNPGDGFSLYTDGLKNSLDLHLNDIETIQKFLSLFDDLSNEASAKQFVEHLFKEVELITRASDPPDDVTSLFFRFLNYYDQE